MSEQTIQNSPERPDQTDRPAQAMQAPFPAPETGHPAYNQTAGQMAPGQMPGQMAAAQMTLGRPAESGMAAATDQAIDQATDQTMTLTAPGTDGSGDDAGDTLYDRAMLFLEGADDMLTYHQAELVRVACYGFDKEGPLHEAQYLLNRASRLAAERDPERPVEDRFNDYIMDFVERESEHLSYLEAEFVRRAARGLDARSIVELQYLLDRALLAFERRRQAA